MLGKNAVGAGEIWIVGNETTPANVVITASTTTGSTIGMLYFLGLSSLYRVRGVTIQATGGTNNGICTEAGSMVVFQNIAFGSGLLAHLRSLSGASLKQEGPYTIAGGAASHIQANNGGFVELRFSTIALTGTPAFSSCFALVQACGVLLANSTFSGSATGTRYAVTLNGVAQTFGGGASYFPGNAAGTSGTGGQYA